MAEGLRGLLSKLLSFENLSFEESYGLAKAIIAGLAPPAMAAALLVALRMKGESAEEVAGFARAMRESCIRIDGGEDAIDTAGTGGDGLGTVNASTGAAIICAAAGVKVVKHGNRSVSSRSGSADVLEALGFNVALDKAEAERLLRETGFTFAFAPLYHPAMAKVMPIRRELGVRTIFNILGPLTNPAFVRRQVVGAFSEGCCRLMAEAAKALGCERAIAVHGTDGVDEVSISSETLVCEASQRGVCEYFVSPEDLGLKRRRLADVLGGDAEANAKLLAKALAPRGEGAVRDFLLANAGAALYAAGAASDMRDGVELARQAIEDGLAIAKLREVVRLSGGSVERLEGVIGA